MKKTIIAILLAAITMPVMSFAGTPENPAPVKATKVSVSESYSKAIAYNVKMEITKTANSLSMLKCKKLPFYQLTAEGIQVPCGAAGCAGSGAQICWGDATTTYYSDGWHHYPVSTSYSNVICQGM